MQKIELLAPAKDLECGLAAIHHGADAIYVGAPQFSARSAAGNTIADIEKLCQYAHLYHAHVHVALNTILTDKELEQARKIIFQLYNAGIDALIIQDLGILQLDIPPLALHASTQMDNRTPEKVLFWEKIGFERVILARELSLSQISEIRKNTHIELEAFVHGALCVSYSGQCYMSQACSGRSANRGTCAQYCRLPYDLVDDRGIIIKEQSHLLSLKDMDRADSLQEMINAGITSFKIEGRLKNADYVKNITAYYRQKLDKILDADSSYQAASAGKTTFSFTPNPQKTFYRGKTDYFLHKRENVMVSPDISKSIGEFIGIITRIHLNSFSVDTEVVLHNGDGLGFINPQGELVGFRINKVENQQITTLEVVPDLVEGTAVYRNFDIEFDKILQTDSASRKIAVNIHFQETADGFLLTLTDEEKIQVELPIVCAKELSQKGEAAKNVLQSNFSKLGNTPFIINELSVDWTKPYFFPVSQINEWRRQAVELLIARRMETAHHPSAKLITPNTISFPAGQSDISSYRANVMNQRAKEFYQMHGIEVTEPAFEVHESAEATLMTCKHCIKYTLGYCSKQNLPKELPFVEPLYLQLHHTLFQLSFDCKKCEMSIKKRNPVC